MVRVKLNTAPWELKGFQRVRLQPGESQLVTFTLHTDELAFYNRKMVQVTEPGGFYVWIGGNSQAELRSEFELVESSESDS